MPRIPLKQRTVTIGHEPRFYAEVGDAVSLRATDGKSLIAATIEAIDGERVTIRQIHDDETQELPAAEVVGVFHT